MVPRGQAIKLHANWNINESYQQQIKGEEKEVTYYKLLTNAGIV